MANSVWERQSRSFQTKIAKVSKAGEMLLDIRFDLSDEKARENLQADITIILKTAECLDEKSQDLVEKIEQVIKDIIEHNQKVIHIAIVYVCIRDNCGTERIVPIFRVHEIPFSSCGIIDHSANFYKDLDSYLNNSLNISLMIPKNARYELSDDQTCKVHVKYESGSPNPNVDVAKPSNTDIVGEMILKSFATIKTDLDTEVSRLEDKLKLTEDQKQIFDELRRGHRESIQLGRVRSIYGDRKFIEEMKSDEVGAFLENFSMTENDHFNINGCLTIHPKAYLQMSKELRIILLEKTKLLKNERISFEEFRKIFTNSKDPKWKSWTRELVFNQDNNSIIRKEELSKLFEVGRLEDLYNNLKPHEVEKLYKVTKYWSKKLAHIYAKTCKDFATKIGVKNFTEFCATSQYIVGKIQNGVKEIRKRNKEENRSKEDISEEIITEFRKDHFDVITTDFRDLLERCGKANMSNSPRFSDSFTAAIHYYKHGDEIAAALKEASSDDGTSLGKRRATLKKNPPLDPKTYFKIANYITTLPSSELKWIQDGSRLKCDYITQNFVAVKYVHVYPEKTEVIATLMRNCKKSKKPETDRKIIPEMWYYHPEY